MKSNVTTQEEKQLLLLLLIDLSARLPYKVKVCLYKKETCILLGIDGYDEVYLDVDSDSFCIESIKPYLRPMEDMTEEEREEYRDIDNRSYSCPIEYAHIPASDRIDWLNKKMFDYRGLIQRGLAIKVTKENNPYKK